MAAYLLIADESLEHSIRRDGPDVVMGG
jgi:hypothetical protein